MRRAAAVSRSGPARYPGSVRSTANTTAKGRRSTVTEWWGAAASMTRPSAAQDQPLGSGYRRKQRGGAGMDAAIGDEQECTPRSVGPPRDTLMEHGDEGRRPLLDFRGEGEHPGRSLTEGGSRELVEGLDGPCGHAHQGVVEKAELREPRSVSRELL